jgi:hypothetical protein
VSRTARRARRVWGALAVAALGLALALPSCGYRMGLTPRGVAGRSVEDIGIEVFDNDSKRPNLERDVHVALSAAARRWADARLVAPSSADLVVRGRIVEVRRAAGIRSPDNELLETGEYVRLEGELYDVRGRRVIRRAVAGVRVGTTLEVSDAEVDAEARAVTVGAERLVLLLLSRPDEEPLPTVAPAVGP